jgi:anti-anti-sigma regulatory factor
VAGPDVGLAVEERLGPRVAVLRAELDSGAAHGLADRRIETEPPAVAVDLSGLTFISAASVGELVQAKHRRELDDAPLVLLGAAGVVRRVFGILRMEGLLAD